MGQSIKHSFIVILLVLFMFSQFSNATDAQHFLFHEDENQIDTTQNNTSQTLIQQKIDAAASYDIINLPDGIYQERITINKPLTLIGENNTIIDGSYQEQILSINADNVTIEHIQFRNTGGNANHSGIYATGNNILIQDCAFYQSKQGIKLQQTRHVRLNSCSFNNIAMGIHIQHSQEISISNCSLSHNAIGILVEASSTTTINNTHFDTNGISLYLLQSDDCIIFNSIVRDNSDNHGGIFSAESTSILIENCLIHHNGIGLNIEKSNKLTIHQSQITNNTHFGILLRKHSTNITIQENTIQQNYRFGIYCYQDTSVNIQRNNINDNFLYSLYSKQPINELESNWWGSPTGPSIIATNKKHRISINNYLAHFQTWSTKPYQYDHTLLSYHNPVGQQIDICKPSLTQYITGMDSDHDGAPNWWEEKWGYDPQQYQPHHDIDEDEDGLSNIEECYTDQWGSHPFKKDIFLEIDWIETTNSISTNKPSILLLNRMQHHFAAQNITLHIDDGRLGKGGRILFQDSSDYSDMINIYWTHFLENNPMNPRKGIFHYAIISDYCADVSYPFFGWDQFDSIAISAQQAKELSKQYPRQMIIVGGIVHQLGSTLGLLAETHPGNDNLQAGTIGSADWFMYRDYKSSMNYLYKYRTLSYSDGSSGKGDFNDWDNLDFNFFKNTTFQG